MEGGEGVGRRGVEGGWGRKGEERGGGGRLRGGTTLEFQSENSTLGFTLQAAGGIADSGAAGCEVGRKSAERGPAAERGPGIAGRLERRQLSVFGRHVRVTVRLRRARASSVPFLWQLD